MQLGCCMDGFVSPHSQFSTMSTRWQRPGLLWHVSYPHLTQMPNKCLVNVCFPEGLVFFKTGMAFTGEISPIPASRCFVRRLKMNTHCDCGLVLLESTTFNPPSFQNLAMQMADPECPYSGCSLTFWSQLHTAPVQ